MVKAFIFDLDGVLQDTEILYVEAWMRVYEDKDCLVSRAEAANIVYGRAKDEIYAKLNSRFPRAYSIIEDVDISLRRHFLELKKTHDVRIHSSIRLLIELAQEFPVCIASGNGRDDVAEAISFLGIESYLTFFLGCEDYAPGKPDPAGYRLAAAKLGLPAEQCLVFEDSNAGVQAAKRAGMYCVALERKGMPHQDLSMADEKLEDLSQFRIERWLS